MVAEVKNEFLMELPLEVVLKNGLVEVFEDVVIYNTTGIIDLASRLFYRKLKETERVSDFKDFQQNFEVSVFWKDGKYFAELKVKSEMVSDSDNNRNDIKENWKEWLRNWYFKDKEELIPVDSKYKGVVETLQILRERFNLVWKSDKKELVKQIKDVLGAIPFETRKKFQWLLIKIPKYSDEELKKIVDGANSNLPYEAWYIKKFGNWWLKRKTKEDLLYELFKKTWQVKISKKEFDKLLEEALKENEKTKEVM